ncbi:MULTISPECIES: MFS transporter [Lelliottia]|uniref:MFS transporter n=1 Tax=Lelliottia aquatilis TaxID=2080838 RepID=A0ABX5A804_9ENTR|nr:MULTISPECIES: MFS transporter [Lelliottia]POZ28547.1 MFS transporter [Lelliottia aquatilis]POZ33802.1 MFS transporter [Lelliottia aquatilis]POZ34336.1 MFS transporter [Lelliottia sp. 7254-16]POZ34870.1 MFS transporter [Lelliottia aquatilis]POZ40122.1 MFS transporter [Lelliottia aquatilis]
MQLTSTESYDDITPLSEWMILLFAVLCAFAVANVYMTQPLLDQIAATFHEKPDKMGIIITATQIGYALGLLLLVPLGDLFNRKRLVAGMLLASSGLLTVSSFASSLYGLSCALGLVGFMAVVVQIIVAYAASLSLPANRGKVTGTVTSGVVLGILLARMVSGVLAEWADWRVAIQFSAGAMLLMALLFIRIAPEDRQAQKPGAYLQLMGSVWTLWREIPELRSRGVLALLIFMNFSVLWTSVVFPLSTAPFNLTTAQIGMFGLAGIAGALASRKAGVLADRGFGQRVTGVALALLLLSWGAIALGGSSLIALTTGIIVLDFAVQAIHVTSQSLIFAKRPQATSRLVAAYMVFYSLGSATGAWLTTWVWGHFAWPGVCTLGAAISGLALLYWLLVDRNLHIPPAD